MANIAKTAVELDAKTGQYQAKMSEASKHTAKVMDKMKGSLESIKKSSSFTAMASGFTAAASGAGMVASAIGVAIDQLQQMAALIGDKISVRFEGLGELAILSKATGMSTEYLSKLGYAAKLTGVNMDDVRGAFESFSAVMAEQGFAGNVEDAFQTSMEMLGQIPDYFTRAASAQKLYGETWGQLNGLIGLSSEKWEAMTNAAQKYGIVVDGELLDSIAGINYGLANFQARSDGMVNALIKMGSPYVITGMASLSGYLDKIGMNADGLNKVLESAPEYINAGIEGASKVLPDIEKSVGAIASASVMAATALAPLVDSLKIIGDQVGAPFKIISSLKNKDFMGYMSGLSSLLSGPSSYLAKEIVQGNNPFGATSGALKAGTAISPTLSSLSEGKNSAAILDTLKQIAKVGSEQLIVQKSNNQQYAVLAP